MAAVGRGIDRILAFRNVYPGTLAITSTTVRIEVFVEDHEVRPGWLGCFLSLRVHVSGAVRLHAGAQAIPGRQGSLFAGDAHRFVDLSRLHASLYADVSITSIASRLDASTCLVPDRHLDDNVDLVLELQETNLS